jgi:hypothetical protein
LYGQRGVNDVQAAAERGVLHNTQVSKRAQRGFMVSSLDRNDHAWQWSGVTVVPAFRTIRKPAARA